MITDLYFHQAKPVEQPSFIEKVYVEVCVKPEPKPLYCEIPEDIKLKNPDASGTTPTYTFTTSMGTASGPSTSTTTTLQNNRV